MCTNCITSADTTRSFKLKASPPPGGGNITSSASKTAPLNIKRSIINPATWGGGTIIKPYRNMKLKERIVIGAAICTVLFTLLILVDLQLGLGVSGKHAPLLSHGRVRLSASNHGPFLKSSTAGFKTRFLQRSNNASKEAASEAQGGASNGTGSGPSVQGTSNRHQVTEAPDDFSDLTEFLEVLVQRDFNNVAHGDDNERSYNPTIGQLLRVKLR